MAASLVSRVLARPSFENAFAAPAFMAAMFRFEAALALAQSQEGVIPPGAAEAIANACAVLQPDVDAIVAEAKHSATLAVPMARALARAVARRDPDFAGYVHYGATSQDVLDTAMSLCLAPVLDDAMAATSACIDSFAAMAREHRCTPMLARTLLQPATPITAGLKIARWAVAIRRDVDRLARARARGLALQLGGPVGALESMGKAAPRVRARMAASLGLADAPSWHSHRAAWMDLLGQVALLVLTVGKIGRDVALLAQAEVGEMRESPAVPGAGGSSAMPHKHNPVACLHALTAAARVPGLLSQIHAGAVAEHERSLGGWQAEMLAVPELAQCLGTAVDALEMLAANLVIDADRMRANVDAMNGVVFSEALVRALCAHASRAQATALVEELCAEASSTGRHLHDVAACALPSMLGLASDVTALLLDGVFSPAALPASFAPAYDEAIAELSDHP